MSTKLQIAAGILIISFIAIINYEYSCGNFSQPNKTKAEKILEDRLILSIQKYNRISNGMTYQQVEEIVGFRSTELSRAFSPAIKGVMNSVETVMYMWNNENGSNMNAMFQNNKLISKAQFGLN